MWSRLNMTKYRLLCLFIGFLCYSLPTRSTLEAQQSASATPAIPATGARDLSHDSGSLSATLDKPLITIAGLCDNPPTEKTATFGCTTVITRAQFERVINSVQPNMPPRARREFALRYADALVMAKRAEQMGLDKGANYKEQMELARIEVLSKELKKVIQERVSQISGKEIEEYYQSNKARFEKAGVDRIYLPKTPQAPTNVADGTLSDVDGTKRSQKSEETVKYEADNLRRRAIDGEEFDKLQADAYHATGITGTLPSTKMEIRRTSLPPNQVSVMDLKPGEVSAVFADPNGYVIYRVKSKDVLPLDQAREEIEATLRLQHMQDETRRIQDSATPTLDESYFVRNRRPRGTMGASEPTKPDSRAPQ